MPMALGEKSGHTMLQSSSAEGMSVEWPLPTSMQYPYRWSCPNSTHTHTHKHGQGDGYEGEGARRTKSDRR